MARASLQQQISELRKLTDPTRRYTDFALQLDVCDGDLDALEIVQRSRIYGGVWDNWGRSLHRLRSGDDTSGVVRIPISAAQYDFLRDDRCLKLICAGRGGGKSHGGLIALLCAALEMAQGLALLVSPTYPLSEVLWDKLLNDLPTAQWLHPLHGIRVARRTITLRNGFRFKFVSADRERQVRAGDADIVFIDERQEIKQRVVDIVRFQLRKRGGYQLMQIGTPLAGTDFQEEYERYEADELASTRHFTSYDNPFIPHDVFRNAEGKIDQRVYRQEVLGEWVAMTGLVYWPFERSRHIKAYQQRTAKRTIQTIFDSIDDSVGNDITTRVLARRFAGGRRPRTLTCVIGMDFNVSPMAAVVYKIFSTPDGVPDLMWAVDEVVLEDHANATRMALELKRRGYYDAGIIPDAMGRHATAGHKSSFRMLHEEDFSVRAPKSNPELFDRVNAVNAKLLNARDETTLLFDPSCVRTVKAVQRQKHDTKGKPEKDNIHDHYADAMGYPIAYLYPASVQRLMNQAA
jgi:hypothetical protein